MVKLQVSPPNLVRYQEIIHAIIGFMGLLDFHERVTSPTYVHNYSFEHLEVVSRSAKYARIKKYETTKNH